jgi:hypothetical protein
MQRIKSIASFTLLSLFLCSCSSKPSLEISVDNLDSAYYNLKTPYASTFKIDIIENSIDDTVQLGKHKIPPHFTGTIIAHHDYYEENYKLSFKSYKGKKGKLKLAYFY